jgi:hypothetical protein
LGIESGLSNGRLDVSGSGQTSSRDRAS